MASAWRPSLPIIIGRSRRRRGWSRTTATSSFRLKTSLPRKHRIHSDPQATLPLDQTPSQTCSRATQFGQLSWAGTMGAGRREGFDVMYLM